MLAEARSELPPERALPGGLAFEQKPDGYRALLFAGPGGHAHLQSRNGTDLSPAFPEIAAAGRALRVPLVLDGELVVTAEGRRDFDQLQQRARRRGVGARLAARDNPADLIVFDTFDTANGQGARRRRPYTARLSGPDRHRLTRQPQARYPAGERMKGGAVNDRVQPLASRAGIPYVGGKKVRAHSLRAGPITDMIAAGVPLRERNRRGRWAEGIRPRLTRSTTAP
ncbi:ATP dependent DNA ligase-like protein [Streptomyces sp. T12]|nr:ATP dependent DNA ligase-like protein [Streptomyces sp. T12]